jgi:hypothetical protein
MAHVIRAQYKVASMNWQLSGCVQPEFAAVRDVLEVLARGIEARHVGETKMNSASSRSHVIFACNVECETVADGVSSLQSSCLNLVDLAGTLAQTHPPALLLLREKMSSHFSAKFCSPPCTAVLKRGLSLFHNFPHPFPRPPRLPL